ncbi:polysaccharide deacetylase family protein [Jiella pelagia]|uniref:NodB homology domain-containing protein n=1 Tax=Jiella pelagia TaxID=2986949 RepID=A0ABY7C0J9_9HYPH|nr:hypothetical protein [Jiella pelagia]WAP67355.1 hypothetical protein OH818_17615 [Jiella pelagia]
MTERHPVSADSKTYDTLLAAARFQERRRVPIADFAYPAGVRIAVNFTLDFDAMLLRRMLNEPWGQKAKGEFGGRVGIWRILAMFEANGVDVTLFTPGRDLRGSTRKFFDMRSRPGTSWRTTCGSTRFPRTLLSRTPI